MCDVTNNGSYGIQTVEHSEIWSKLFGTKCSGIHVRIDFKMTKFLREILNE